MTDPANVVSRLTLIKAVEDRLANLPVTSPPTRGYLSKPVDVPELDSAGHVQRYWVLHPFFGLPGSEHDLADTVIDLDWTFQITVAAGFPRDAYALATRIDELVYRWAPDIEGYECGRCQPPPGYDPGNARPDDSVKPTRFFLPLQYRTTITRHLPDPA